jgi:toxin ParE1/3/4
MRLKWSALAFEDRRVIFEYIEADNPPAAVRVDSTIREQVKQLLRSPELGRPGRVAGTRELVIGHTPYIAASRIAKDVIKILRVLHGAQQWPKEF